MESTTVKCILTRIRWQNDSGFTIGEFKGAKEDFSALGSMVDPGEGITYTLRGHWKHDEKWGKQFHFSTYDIEEPKDERGIYHYLLNVASWIGAKTAERLLDEYGEQTLEVLKNRPGEVADKIKGLTIKRARDIQKQLKENEQFEAARVELEGLLHFPNVKKDLSTSLVKKYGSDAPRRVKENPYILTQFRFVGFKQADLIAVMKMGFDRDSMFRKTAAAKHVIKEMMQKDGSVWIERGLLESAMLDLLQVKDVSSSIDELIEKENFAERSDHVTLSEAHNDENVIARTVCWLVQRRRYEYK